MSIKYTAIINHGKKNVTVNCDKQSEVLMHVMDALLDSSTNSVIIYKETCDKPRTVTAKPTPAEKINHSNMTKEQAYAAMLDGFKVGHVEKLSTYYMSTEKDGSRLVRSSERCIVGWGGISQSTGWFVL